MHRLYMLFLFLCLAAGPVAQEMMAQPVMNGNFETWSGNCPVNTVPIGWTNYSTSFGPDRAGACAGTVASLQGTSHMNLVWYSGFNLYEGAVQKMSGLGIGAQYRVDFYAVHDQDLYSFGDPAILDFYVDTTVVFSTPELTSGGTWAPYSVTFTATDTAQNIGFRVRAGSSGSSGCVGIDSVTFHGLTPVKEKQPGQTFRIFPNPAEDDFYFATHEPGTVLHSIKNICGLEMWKPDVPQPDGHFNIRALPPGLYLLEVSEGDRKSFVKLVKKY